MNGATSAGKRRYRLNFRELMRLCEENYGRMMPLMRVLGDEDAMSVSVPGPRGRDAELTVSVLERARYTTILRLEQSALHDLLPPARITVRLYHDARLAEVTEALPFRGIAARYAYPNRNMHQQDEKHQWNRFLAEWLRHLREFGGSRRGLSDRDIGVMSTGGSPG